MSRPQTAPAAPVSGVVGATSPGASGLGGPGAPAHTFDIGDRVGRIGAFAGVHGTVTAHDRTVYGEPILWVLVDGYAHSHLYRQDHLIRVPLGQLDLFEELMSA